MCLYLVIFQVGLHTEHGYARSLARFAAGLGPVAWKIASMKLQRVLPNGVDFGPGWVGEKPNELQQAYVDKQNFSNNFVVGEQSNRHMSPATSGSNSHFGNRYSAHGVEDTEFIREVDSQCESTCPNSSSPLGMKPAPSFQIPTRPLMHTDTNGFTSGDNSGFHSQPPMGISRHDTSLVKSTFDNNAMPSQMHGIIPDSNHGFVSAPAWPSQMHSLISDNNNGISLMPAKPSQMQSLVSDNNQGFNSIPVSEYNGLVDSSSRLLHSGNSLVLGSGPYPSTKQQANNATWQGFSAFQKPDCQPFAPPDLNARFLAPGSPIPNMQMGSPQQPDLALQL